MGVVLRPYDPSLALRLRAEVHAMAEAYVESLLKQLPRGAVVGVHCKGSAYKAWHSEIDYVPVLSDVDLHVRLRRDADDAGIFGGLQEALGLAERALVAFHARVREPSHLPRPQLLVLNALERMPGYLPSPVGSMHTLYGEPESGGDRVSYADTRDADAARFREDARFVREELPEKVADRPGAHAWTYVRQLAWRVGPTGPRLLTHLGVHPHDAWRLNRSGVVRELLARDREDLATSYAHFYTEGWQGYRTGFRDGAAARRALLAVDQLFADGARVIGS